MPMIAHIADVHLGAAQYGMEERFNDVFDSFSFVINDILRERPDVVVVAGDLFDKPKPDNVVVRRAYNMLKMLSDKGIPVVVAHGEHDTPQRRDETVLMLLSDALERFYAPHVLGATSLAEVAARMKIDVGGVTVYVTPFIRGSPSKRKELVRSVFKSFPGGRRSILLGHFSLENEFPNDVFTLTLKDLPPVAYAALGHIHRHILNMKASPPYAYPGVLDPLKIDEARMERSRLLYVDLGGDEPSVQSVEVPVRPQRVVTVKVESSFEASNLQARLQQLIEAEIRKVKEAPKPPLIHVIVKVSGVPKSLVALHLSRIEPVYRQKGVLLRFKIEDLLGAEKGASSQAHGKLDLIEIGVRIFSRYGLTREDVEAVVRHLVEALVVENDHEKAAEIIERLASRKSPKVWERIARGG